MKLREERSDVVIQPKVQGTGRSKDKPASTSEGSTPSPRTHSHYCWKHKKLEECNGQDCNGHCRKE